MDTNMSEEPKCTLRRRRPPSSPNLALNVGIGYQINEGGPDRGTPSPCGVKFIPTTREPSTSQALLEFRKKQQSFDVESEDECEEEEIIIESDEENGEENEASTAARPITPTPVQDFAANVVYTEGPISIDFLKVKAIEQECTTDVSDADTDDEEE